MLREEFLIPLGMTPYGLAKNLKVPRTRIERLVREETALTPDTALRLARYFGTSPEFWLNMQSVYDLTVAEMSLKSSIGEITPMHTKVEAA
jgi:addiction module HigA family antidote